MANAQIMVPFILKSAGGWVNNPNDKGGETNKDITLTVWQSVFGMFSHDRFMAMAQDDWYTIFKRCFWDNIFGDSIASQRIANTIVDFVWGSGLYTPEKLVQEALNDLGGHLTIDGVFGPATIEAINSTANEEELYKHIIQKHIDFINALVKNNPSQEVFYKGWMNRINNLIQYNQNLPA